MIDVKRLIIKNLNISVVLFALIAIVIFFSILNPNFFTFKNAIAVGLLLSVVGVICLGQSLCILVRGFDLAVGQLAALAGIMLALLTKSGVPYPVGIAIVFVFGLFAGGVAGVLITKLKINALITTLALQTIYHGLVYILSNGASIIVSAPTFSAIGTTRVFDIPLPIIFLAVLYIVFHFILRRTVFGRSIYCIGGNPEAARISGINNDKIITSVYVLSSLLAVFAGVVLSSRMGAAQITAGGTYAMDSIAAVVLGGIALSGGRGSIWGSLMGIAIIGAMQNGLIMIQMPIFYQYVATGAVLIIAVFVQNISDIRNK